MDKLNQIRIKTAEFHELAKEIVSNACHGALLAKGFVADERIVEEGKGKLNFLLFQIVYCFVIDLFAKITCLNILSSIFNFFSIITD